MAVGGTRHHLGRVERSAGRDGADGRSRRARRLRRPRARCTSGMLPLMQINFVESNPMPVKFAMAAMGLREESYRLPMVPPQARVAREDPRRAAGVRPADRRAALGTLPMAMLQDDIAELFAAGAAADRDAARAAFAALRAALSSGTRPRGRARRVDADRLARQHVGEAGDSPRLPLRRRRRRRRCRSRQVAVLRQGHAAAEAARGSPPASASCPADRRSATAPTSRPA